MPAKLGKVEGADETARAFDKLADDVRDMRAINETVARSRIPGVASLTPVRSGALRGSWDTESGPDGASILSPLPYSGPVEYGVPARRIEPVAMVRRTLAAEEAKATAEYQAGVLDLAKKRGFPIG